MQWNKGICWSPAQKKKVKPMWKEQMFKVQFRKKLISIQVFDKFILAQSPVSNKQKTTILSNHPYIIKFSLWNLHR